MKKKLVAAVPFITIPILIPIYCILDSLILVDIFGCGCVPTTQTNTLNIPFNANDLRLTVFSVLTIVMTIWGIAISTSFQKTSTKMLYRIAVVLLNTILTMWVVKAFMWA